MKRSEIEEEILAWMSEPTWAEDDARFEELALALFQFQYDHCEAYARFCQALGRTPEETRHFADIPAIPSGAFKEFDLCCFDLASGIKTFQTSGTSADRRGHLHLDTLKLYEASLLASLRRNVLDDLCGQRPRMRFLAPDIKEAPNSSLTHMFETLRLAEGGPESAFDLHDGQLDLDALQEAIRAAGEGESPMLLLGTSFAFVHLLDATVDSATNAWRLPPGSRLIETGGFKGRSREVHPRVLRDDLARRFAIPETSIINQYGMTELGSQFYDSTWLDRSGPRRKFAPPWTRVRIIDPMTRQDVAPGEEGMIVIHDLANTGSIAAIQTADLGQWVPVTSDEEPGFNILGRFDGAEERGCSIATDIMLEASGRAEQE
jgi:hypothetical protein